MRSSFLSGVVVVVCLFLEIVVGGPNQVVISNPECDAADVVIEDASGTLCNCAAISDLQTRVTELENNNNNGVTYYIGSWGNWRWRSGCWSPLPRIRILCPRVSSCCSGMLLS